MFPEKCLGEINDGILKIGSVTMPVYNPSEKMKVPDVLFYENAQVSRICWLLKHRKFIKYVLMHIFTFIKWYTYFEGYNSETASLG